VEVDVALLIGNYIDVRLEILEVVNVKSTIFQHVAHSGVNMYLSFRGRVVSQLLVNSFQTAFCYI